jgi:hypothetical protein
MSLMAMTSRTIYKSLWAALGLGPVDLHAILAQVAVLYEDLRLELTGLEKEFPDLQAIGKNYRRNYFVRRSIATLVEFSVALKMLDDNADWQAVKARFNSESAAGWLAAMKYCKENHLYLKKIRDDFGGHFGFKAARWAVQNLSKDAPGSIEIYKKPTENKAGPKMHFASEFVSTAMCRHKGNLELVDHLRYMYRTTLEGYGHATNCVHIIVVAYFYERFSG